MASNFSAEEKESRGKSFLEHYVKDRKIFIDTCSLLSKGADRFWEHVIPLLHQYHNKIIIPLRVVEELQKHQKSTAKPQLAEDANHSLRQLQQLLQAGYVEIRGEASDNFADNVFQTVFTKFRMQYKLLLITQDNDLAKDILNLNKQKSVRANPVQVLRINPYGYLNVFQWSRSKETPSHNQPEPEEENHQPDRFQLCTKVTQLEDTVLPVSRVPGEGESAYTPQGAVQLVKKVAAGGEGIIYTTNTPYVAKIYKKENITQRRYEKIKRMLSKKIQCDGICYPVDLLYNAERQFVGYLMSTAKGKELQKSIFIKPLFLKNFPNWKKRDTVELCVTILEKIKYLHDRNIIMGDINPANILVVSPKEVYFVDTDSYQIEDFPCPVGTVNYTAPEIQGKNFAGFLRTMGNENFAVATLLFMVMLPGKPPYSQQGGENPAANIINMDFSYPFGENSNKKTPDGPWRYIWSHLTYDLKEAFYNTFRKEGEHSTESTRLSVDAWLSIFRYYLDLLDSGKFGQQDKMSEELFPTRHKKNPRVTYVTCRICGSEVAENQCRNGICRECLNKGQVYYCTKCGKELLYTNYQKYILGAPRHELCQECFEHGRQVWRQFTCVDCGREFEITNRQHDYYVSRGLEIPKRCRFCRDARKNRTQTPSRPAPAPRPTTRKGSFCFLTTAVCDYLGKPDDCVELNTLRHFRDTWLRNQPDGPALIAQYYNKAPLIVSRLKASPQFEECCQLLWTQYIRPCLDLIANKQYAACKERYTEMFRYMEAKFGENAA